MSDGLFGLFGPDEPSDECTIVQVTENCTIVQVDLHDGLDGKDGKPIQPTATSKLYRPGGLTTQPAEERGSRGLCCSNSSDGEDHLSIQKFIRDALICELPSHQRGNPFLPLARRLKFHPPSIMKELSAECAFREVKVYFEDRSIKFSDFQHSNGNPTLMEDFLKAWDDAKIPEGTQPLADAIKAAFTAESLQFPSERARLVPRYNFVLNVIRELRTRSPEDEDLFISSTALRELLVKSGQFRVASRQQVGTYLQWATRDKFLTVTAEAVRKRKARRYRFNDPFMSESSAK